MKKLLIIFLLLPGFVMAQITGKVVKVKDGDTIVILDKDKNQHTIRVADIDTPEYKQPFSMVAKRFTSDAVFGQDVYIKSKGKDRYGRTIGFVFYGQEKNLSEELLKAGLAWHYVKYSDSPDFQKIENRAREARLGLWVDPEPVSPWTWRSKKFKMRIYN